MAKLSIYFFPNYKKQSKRNGRIPIYFRIIGFRQKAEARLSIEVQPESISLWNQNSMRFISAEDNANKLINKYQQTFDDYILINAQKLCDLSAKELRNEILGIKKSSQIVAKDFVNQQYQDFVLRNDATTEGTKKNYKKAIIHFFNFLDFKGFSDITIQKLNHYNGREFLDYLLLSEPKYKKLPLAEPSAAGYIKKIKCIFQKAVYQGIIQINPFDGLKLKTKSPKRDKLNSFEIRNIYHCDLTNYPNLCRIRDYFIFSTFTGLAYSDIMDLKEENLQHWKDELTLLELKRTKTSVETRQFLCNQSILLIKKYKCIFDNRNTIFPKISNQKYNDGLKILAEKLSIKKNLSSHIARHSFRQIIAESGIRDIATIKLMMGHSRNNDIDAVYHTVTEKQLIEAKVLLQEYINELTR